MATDVPTYAEETWVPDAAPGISAAQLQRIDDQIRALTDEFNLHNGGDSVLDHPVATTGVIGFMAAGDKLKADGIGVAHAASNDHPVATAGVKGMMSSAQFNKLGGIEAGATGDQSDAEHLAAVVPTIGPSIFEMSARVEIATVAIGTTLTAHHSFTFVKPSGWGTYSLMVIANALYTAGSVNAVITAHIDIDGVDSSSVPGTVGSAIQETTLVCSHVFGHSGNAVVKMETIRVGGTQTDAKNTSYQMFASRQT